MGCTELDTTGSIHATPEVCVCIRDLLKDRPKKNVLFQLKKKELAISLHTGFENIPVSVIKPVNFFHFILNFYISFAAFTLPDVLFENFIKRYRFSLH